MNEEQKISGIDTLMNELDAGLLGKRIATALAESALGVVATGDKKKRGKVTVTFDIGQVGESNQVQIDHTVEFKKPTHRGSASEVNTTSSVMYVGMFGKLTLLNNETKPMFARERDDA